MISGLFFLLDNAISVQVKKSVLAVFAETMLLILKENVNLELPADFLYNGDYVYTQQKETDEQASKRDSISIPQTQ